jgi:hypothetical protein
MPRSLLVATTESDILMPGAAAFVTAVNVHRASSPWLWRAPDVLPGVRAGDFHVAMPRLGCFLLRHRLPPRQGGLTPAPQAFRLSARPAARMFLAAPVIPIVPSTTLRTEPFPDRQRPWRPPRAHRPNRSFHDGNHRDTVTTTRPQRSAFSSSSRTNPPHPASEITRANRRFVPTPTMPEILDVECGSREPGRAPACSDTPAVHGRPCRAHWRPSAARRPARDAAQTRTQRHHRNAIAR